MTNFRILLTFCLYASLSVRGQITFEKVYGGSGQEFGYTVRQASDNGYILIGSTESYSSSRDIYLVKTDKNGNSLWTKTFGWSNFDSGHDVQQTTDGGYIIFGMINSKAYLIKTNNFGDTLWTKTHIGHGNKILVTADNGYVIAGEIGLSGTNNNMLLIKTNSNGDTLWTKTYGKNQADGCWDFKKTNDGGFILVGYTTVGIASDIYLVKVNSIGDTLWTKSFGGSGNDYGYSVEQTSDNGYILFGNSDSFGGEKFYLIKTNINGDSIWTKTYSNGNLNDEGYEVKQTSDGGYIFVAETDKNGFPYSEVYLVKTNSNGDTLWTRTYKQGSGVGLQITSDGGYVVIGFTASFGAGMNDIYLIKTDNNGIVSEILDTEVKDNIVVNYYPNPCNKIATIEFENYKNLNHTLKLFDSQGQLIRTISNINTDKVEIENQNLTSGLYYFQLCTDKHIIGSGKIIISD